MGQIYQMHFCELNFYLVCLQNGDMPRHKNSAIRGGLGHGLLRMHCLGDSGHCEKCFCKRKCIVQNVMYAPFQIKAESVTEESAGYVLSCADHREYFEEGDSLHFRMILFGDVIAYFTSILQAVHAMGMQGLGGRHTPFAVACVKNRRGQKILEGNDVHLDLLHPETLADFIAERKKVVHGKSFCLKFLSPCTIKYKGEYLKKFDAEPVIYAAARRVRMLHLFEGIDMERDWWETEHMPVMAAEHAKMESVPRYSGRGNQAVELKGITGWMQLDEVQEDILDMLLAGEIVGIGKNTKFGFGVYEVEACRK